MQRPWRCSTPGWGSLIQPHLKRSSPGHVLTLEPPQAAPTPSLPVPSLSEVGSALLGHPASFTEPLSTARRVSYHDAGVRLVVVGGVHTLEPLLACRVPKVCNRNTTLSGAAGGQRDPDMLGISVQICVCRDTTRGRNKGRRARTCASSEHNAPGGVTEGLCTCVCKTVSNRETHGQARRKERADRKS